MGPSWGIMLECWLEARFRNVSILLAKLSYAQVLNMSEAKTAMLYCVRGV